MVDEIKLLDEATRCLGKNWLGGVHAERLIYWNEQGVFDNINWRNKKILNKYMSKSIPRVNDEKTRGLMPGWMAARSSFTVELPLTIGGAPIKFIKAVDKVIFQGRAWISTNAYVKVNGCNFMVHCILEWASGVEDKQRGNPHITIRNLEEQSDIVLDRLIPLKDKQKRVGGELAATRSSYSRGKGGDRKVGDNVPGKAKEHVKTKLDSEEVNEWLDLVVEKAQQAWEI